MVSARSWAETPVVQPSSSVECDGGAEHPAGVDQHKVDHLGGYLLGGTYQVAFVLAVFVVNDNDELSLPEVCQRLLNRI